MDPYIMIWAIPASARFSLKVTSGEPYPGQALSPAAGTCINSGYPYEYVLFTNLTIDIYSGPDGTGQKLKSTTIRMVTQGNKTYPLDDNNILIMNYDASRSIYPSSDPWKKKNYFEVTAPSLPIVRSVPPIISNVGWFNGMGNFDSEPTPGKNFWVADYGDGFWAPDFQAEAIQQSTAVLRGGSRAYPIHIDEGAPNWKVSGGVGVAFDGLWQIDIKIGSNGAGDFCETFYLSERYLSERYDLAWGPDYYSDGNGGGDLKDQKNKKVPKFGSPPKAYSREIDIMETKWTPSGPQINLPSGGGTGWAPNPADWGRKKVPNWKDVGGAPTRQFITFGCLIRDDNLWLYAYNEGNQWYCTKAVEKVKSDYVQKHPFVPYIGTWTEQAKKGGGFYTKYRNFVYLPPNDSKIKGKNPHDNPGAFGKPLITPPFIIR